MRWTTSVFIISFVAFCPLRLRAGTVFAGIDLIIRDSNSHPRAAASVWYKTALGLEGHETTQVDSMILGSDASYSGTILTPYNWSLEGSEAATPPTCYQGRIVATADDSDVTVLSNRICFQGPEQPAPPPGGGGTGDGTFDTSGGGSDPLVISFNGSYDLSGLDDPVSFDINATGHAQTIGWTARYADVAFLALDRNRNGRVDDGSELFGNATLLGQGVRARNGFEALAQYDLNGDGVIDVSDPVWDRLLLWVDANHNGQSEPHELRRMTASPITAITLQHHWAGVINSATDSDMRVACVREGVSGLSTMCSL